MGRVVHVGADVLGDCVRAQQRQVLELAVEDGPRRLSAAGGVISVFGESGGHEITFDLTMLRRGRARVCGASRTGASREDFVQLLDLFTERGAQNHR